jgi:hypothetical protein
MRSLICFLMLLTAWSGGPAAAASPADDPSGACCMPDGTCLVATHADCVEGGGAAWIEGEDCQADCPPPGTCCLPEGSCALMLEVACLADEGVFEGQNACDPQICLVWGRRCYVGNRVYCLKSPAECAALNGTWRRLEACLLNGRGACCLPDGSCLVEPMEQCEADGGTFQGDEVPCNPEFCADNPSGQCCLADGACMVAVEADCYRSGGVDWTAGGSCDSGCPLPGACCLSDGACAVVLGSACGDFDGIFQGEGTDCSAGACPPVPAREGSWGAIKARYR